MYSADEYPLYTAVEKGIKTIENKNTRLRQINLPL
jgi:hypothetical protein